MTSSQREEKGPAKKTEGIAFEAEGYHICMVSWKPSKQSVSRSRRDSLCRMLRCQVRLELRIDHWIWQCEGHW